MLRIPIGPLRKGERFDEPFDHLNAGTEGQRISDFAQRDIFPFLSDHYVVSAVRYPSVPVCPDESTVGRFEPYANPQLWPRRYSAVWCR